MCVSPAAVAQEGGAKQMPRKAEPRPRARDGQERWHDPLIGRFPLANVFRPLPEDHGPLTATEQREALRFLRRCVPHVHRELMKLRRRDPVSFGQRLEDAAPRLRQLRRIFERDPELGRNIIQHAENLQRMRRARMAWRDSAEKPELRPRIHALVRRLAAQNLRIEAAVLDDRLRQLSEQRENRIDAWLQRLQADELQRAGEPPEIRDLIDRWSATRSDEERRAIAAQLRQLGTERLDREVSHLRRRLARMRENAGAEVDRRVERWLRQAEHAGRRRVGEDDADPPKKQDGTDRGRRRRP